MPKKKQKVMKTDLQPSQLVYNSNNYGLYVL